MPGEGCLGKIISMDGIDLSALSPKAQKMEEYERLQRELIALDEERDAIEIRMSEILEEINPEAAEEK